MSATLPVYGDTLWIPVWNSDAKGVEITWSQDMTPKIRPYYEVMGSYGPAKKDVRVFIAEQYYNSKYANQGWPNHLMNLAPPSGEPSPAHRVTLNERFMYGQNTFDTPSRERFIVYHPLDRAPSQARFVDDTLMVLLKGVTPISSERQGVLEFLGKLLILLGGDPLHPFTAPNQRSVALVADQGGVGIVAVEGGDGLVLDEFGDDISVEEEGVAQRPHDFLLKPFPFSNEPPQLG